MNLRCECCGVEGEFSDGEEVRRAGWDAPPRTTYVACNLCPAACVLMGLPHTRAHALWQQIGRPEAFSLDTCADDHLWKHRRLPEVSANNRPPKAALHQWSQKLLGDLGLAVSGKDLQRWRRRLLLLQADAAVLLGISQRTLSAYERGEMPIPPAILIACAGYEDWPWLRRQIPMILKANRDTLE